MRASRVSGAAGLLLPALVLAHGAGAQVVDTEGFEIGGAVRQNLVVRSWDKPDNFTDSLELDTIYLTLQFDRAEWIASAQWRLYYAHKGEDQVTSFVQHAWLGRRFADGDEIRVGINKVPFGLLPFASNSWFFSIAYYLGLEDDYDLGAQYISPPDWRLQWRVAAYLGDEGSGFGDSRNSARYSYDIVDEGEGDHEGPQGNLWASYRLTDEGGPLSAWIGASAQYGKIPNRITGRDGDHWAFAVFFHGEYKTFGLQWQSLWYGHDLGSAPGLNRRVVTFGAYDAPYSVAAKGSVHAMNLTWKPEISLPWLDALALYNDFSVLMKNERSFRSSYHNIVGLSLDFAGPLFVFIDFGMGKGSPFLTPDFTEGLAAGGTRWHSRFNVNLGLYF